MPKFKFIATMVPEFKMNIRKMHDIEVQDDNIVVNVECNNNIICVKLSTVGGVWAT